MYLRSPVLLFALFGSLFAQTRIVTASGQLSMEVPVGFVQTPAKALPKRVPRDQSGAMFQSLSADAVIVLMVAVTNAEATDLPPLKTLTAHDLDHENPPARRLVSELITFQGKPCLHHEYFRWTAAGKEHNQAYYVLSNHDLLFFEFTMQEKGADRYRSILQKALASIRFPAQPTDVKNCPLPESLQSLYDRISALALK